MKKIFFLFAFASIIFYGCNNKKHPKMLSRIDSLNTVIDSIQINLFSVDTLRINNIFTDYSTNLGLIKKYFVDKKEANDWEVMTTYGNIKKPLKSFIRDYPKFKNEISFSRNQLDTLKTDIGNGKLDGVKISDYIKQEAEAINNLKQQVLINVAGAKEKIKLFDSLNPKVVLLITKLKNKGKLNTEKKSSEEEDD